MQSNQEDVPSAVCDECEQQPASRSCDACGLVYCSPCDVHRHRKGKLQLHERVAIRIKPKDANNAHLWTVHDVCTWLEERDLALFVDEAKQQQIDGQRLLDTGLDTLLQAPGVSRGHKKKLQREVHKLGECMHPIEPQSRSMQRIGLDLKVHVHPEPRRMKMPPLTIEVGDAKSPTRADARQGLGIDIAQVKEKTVAASFDFSATGRLQTQGFEINTRGITNAPFRAVQDEVKQSTTTESPGTRDCLLLLNELGHGAGGKVYKALYMPTFRLVAVKVIRVYDQKKRHQMVRELKSLYVNYVQLASATVQSTPQAACEELVVFYDAYTNPGVGSVSIVLEYMDGGSLEDYVQSVTEGGKAEGGCLSEKEIANIAACGLKGLAFLHEHHQLHRDIKLSNMLINYQGQVKISDFGISRDLESTLAKATTFTGTLLYMAPERISGGMYSYPSDIWSFGLAVMACAIGRLPVPSKDGYWGVVHAVQEQPSPRLADYGDHFSAELCDFLDQCLQKNPMFRPPAVRLLEHPFITKNYSPREQANVRLSRDQQPRSAKALELSRQEMRDIADKAKEWCREHGNALRHDEVSDNNREFVSSAGKIEALAKQLHLPVDEVAPHFAFLDEY